MDVAKKNKEPVTVADLMGQTSKDAVSVIRNEFCCIIVNKVSKLVYIFNAQ